MFPSHNNYQLPIAPKLEGSLTTCTQAVGSPLGSMFDQPWKFLTQLTTPVMTSVF